MVEFAIKSVEKVVHVINQRYYVDKQGLTQHHLKVTLSPTQLKIVHTQRCAVHWHKLHKRSHEDFLTFTHFYGILVNA